MTEMRRFALADYLLLLLVLLAAGGLRAGYLMAEAENARKDPPARVQDPSPELELPDRPSEMHSLVGNLRAHTWFGTLAPFANREEQTAHVAPGLPWLLSGLARVVPDDRLDSTVRWLNAGLGAVTAVLYFLFARRAFRSLTVATVAGLFCALHPFWIVDTGVFDDGALAAFLLALAVLLGARSAGTGGPFASLLYGLALAGLALVRAAMLPFAFVALIWFLHRSRTLARGWLCGLLAFLGFANGLAPWTVRNIQVFGEPFPVVDSMWLHLWVGNNPQATGGPPTPAMREAAPTAKLRDDKGRLLRQPDRYAALAGSVLDEVRERPVEALRRRIMAGVYFVFGEDFFRAGRLAEGEVPHWLRVSLFAALLVMLPLAALGWRWSYEWRKESMPLSLALMWVPLPYLLGHAEGLSGPRLPLDGVLLTFAAFALCCLLPRIGRGLRERGQEGA
jgi:4-amino-4-deoxy-L-arabinose transferase-like glycosyltransferase